MCINPTSKLEVIPEVFSPNNDGDKDFTSINLQIRKAGEN